MELWAPDSDLSETDNEYYLMVDLPGMSKKDIEVSYQNKRLTISGERKLEEKETTKDLLRKERYHGRFLRSFTLPEEIKEENIKANFKDGVLTVKIPKSEVQKRKLVPID